MDTEAQVLHHATLRTMRATIAERDARIAALESALRDIVTATSKEGSKPSAEIIEFCFQSARAAIAGVRS